MACMAIMMPLIMPSSMSDQGRLRTNRPTRAARVAATTMGMCTETSQCSTPAPMKAALRRRTIKASNNVGFRPVFADMFATSPFLF